MKLPVIRTNILLQKLFPLPSLPLSLKKKDLPEIAQLLMDNDSAVRYWGAMGLLTHKKAGTQAFAKELSMH